MKTEDGCFFPEDRTYFVEYDLWLKPGDAGEYIVGVCQPYLFFTGKPSVIKVKPKGSLVKRNTALALMTTMKTEAPVLSPVSCEVVEVNEKLLDSPKVIADDVYGDGWLAKVVIDPDQVTGVAASEAAAKYLEINRSRGVVCLNVLPDHELRVFGESCEQILTQVGDFVDRHVSANEYLHVITADPATEVDMIDWANKTGHSLVYLKRFGKILHVVYRKRD